MSRKGYFEIELLVLVKLERTVNYMSMDVAFSGLPNPALSKKNRFLG